MLQIKPFALKTEIKTRPFSTSFALSLGFVGIYYSLFHPSWHVNDDPAMAMIGAGVVWTNTGSEFIVFVNILLGKLIKFLGELYPGTFWYSIAVLGLTFLSLWQSILITFLSNHFFPKTLINFIFLFYLYSNYFFSITFTKTAILLGLTSGILFIFAETFLQSRKRTICVILSSFGIFCTSLLRFEAFLLSLILLTPLLTVHLFKKIRTHNYSADLMIMFTGVFLALATRGYHNSYYAKNLDWQSSGAAQKTLAFILDYGRTLKDANNSGEVFKRTGITQTDWDMVRSWLFPESVISDESLLKLENELNQPTISFPVMIRQLLKSLQSSQMVIICLGLSLIWCALFSQLTSWLFFFLYFAIIVIYFITYRKLPERVLCPMSAFFPLSALALIDTKINLTRSKKLAFLFSALLISKFTISEIRYILFLDKENQIRQAQLMSDLTQIKKYSNNLFVVVPLSVGFENLPVVKYPHSLLSSFQGMTFGWLSRTSLFKKRIQNFKVQDIFYSLSDRKDLIVVSTQKSNVLLHTYIKNKFNKNISFIPIYDGSQFKLWRPVNNFKEEAAGIDN
ncbi:MAG: hypothetical protein FJ116_10540 [Deltaproteobacteria bacterium]|nr:hypothetical protein [Deltaproteobacteria bacterium]